ncbi:MAG: histidine triad nucleotide-binding protein [Verrucomicrobiota bacterium]|nr:histidine triad nucleotide-binding protein [Verrucomicrobiota bacterium]
MTVFKEIIEGRLPAKKVYEDDRLIVIEDIRPVAPIHLLIIPKKEIPTLQDVAKEDLPLVAHMIEVAQEVAKSKGIAEGYRLVANVGAGGGQEVFHLHFHLISGGPLGKMV